MRVAIQAIVVFCLLALLASIVSVSATWTGWSERFSPFVNPGEYFQMALAMSCNGPKDCYIAGGSGSSSSSQDAKNVGNGGFATWHYDGAVNGGLSQLTDPNGTSMIVTSLSVGGAAAQPKGIVGGIDFMGRSIAIQYFESKTELEKSIMPLEIMVFAVQGVAASQDGMTQAAVGSGIMGNQLLMSGDAGQVFANVPIKGYTPPNKFCDAPGTVAFGADNVLWMTYGSEPNNNNGGSSSGGSSSSFSAGVSDAELAAALPAGVDAKYLKADEIIVARKSHGQVMIVKNVKTGAVRTEAKTPIQWGADLKEAAAMALKSGNNDNNNNCTYHGDILKSSNNGKSFEVAYRNTEYQVGSIECFGKSCTAIAFGPAGNLVLNTVDSVSWKHVFQTPPPSQTEATVIGAVTYASAEIVWLAGAYQSQSDAHAMFWKSVDGGQSFILDNNSGVPLPSVMAITGVSSGSADTAFAVGLTMMKTSQIVGYGTQAQKPSYFSQKDDCIDATCSICLSHVTFAQNACLPTRGGSAIATCIDGNTKLQQKVFETTSCVGSFNTSTMATNKCYVSNNGGQKSYFESICGVGSVEEAKLKMPAGSKVRRALAHDKVQRF